MAKKNKETPSDLQSEKKNKPQEVWKTTTDSIKEILTSNWEKILFTDEEIQSILGNRWEWDLWELNIDKDYQYNDIRIIASCLKNLDRNKMKKFIRRKKEYLEKNRTISKEKFEELFWWSGKYWKAEINQREIWMCGTYSWLELLKKINWFDEMIQTNLRETENWWEVRMPFCDKNWTWIKVKKNEIDLKIPHRFWWLKNVNSLSKFLWFKILEIALIKKRSISGILPWIREDFEKEFESTWDISLSNNEILLGLEGNWRDEATNIFLGDFILHQFDHFYKKNLMDLAFNYHEKGLYKIMLHTWKIYNYIKNPIIINRTPDQLIWDDGTDIITDENWNKSVTFVPNHVYSIEKCYVTSEWKKRVRVVNPWHTWIKFDIPLEDCKSIFEREVVGIDIDKMFR